MYHDGGEAQGGEHDDGGNDGNDDELVLTEPATCAALGETGGLLDSADAAPGLPRINNWLETAYCEPVLH